jgi:hypothetical protein
LQYSNFKEFIREKTFKRWELKKRIVLINSEEKLNLLKRNKEFCMIHFDKIFIGNPMQKLKWKNLTFSGVELEIDYMNKKLNSEIEKYVDEEKLNDFEFRVKVFEFGKLKCDITEIGEEIQYQNNVLYYKTLGYTYNKINGDGYKYFEKYNYYGKRGNFVFAKNYIKNQIKFEDCEMEEKKKRIENYEKDFMCNYIFKESLLYVYR